jgi:hypothetical protein
MPPSGTPDHAVVIKYSTGTQPACRRSVPSCRTWLAALTRNLGYRDSADRWLRSLLSAEERPDLVFVQEVSPGLLTSPPSGYAILAGQDAFRSAVGRMSALLIRDGAAENRNSHQAAIQAQLIATFT